MNSYPTVVYTKWRFVFIAQYKTKEQKLYFYKYIIWCHDRQHLLPDKWHIASSLLCNHSLQPYEHYGEFSITITSKMTNFYLHEMSIRWSYQACSIAPLSTKSAHATPKKKTMAMGAFHPTIGLQRDHPRARGTRLKTGFTHTSQNFAWRPNTKHNQHPSMACTMIQHWNHKTLGEGGLFKEEKFINITLPIHFASQGHRNINNILPLHCLSMPSKKPSSPHPPNLLVPPKQQDPWPWRSPCSIITTSSWGKNKIFFLTCNVKPNLCPSPKASLPSQGWVKPSHP